MRVVTIAATTVLVALFGFAAFAQKPAEAPPPQSQNPPKAAGQQPQTTEEIIKQIEENRNRFEQQQRETDELFNKTIDLLKSQQKSIREAEKAVDDLIARVESTVGKAGDNGDLTAAIDSMINEAVAGKARAESLRNEGLINIFSDLEKKYKGAKQALSDARVDALAVLRQLKAQRDVMALAAKAGSLEQAYAALDEAIKKFKEMTETGKKLLESLPKPPGS